MDNFEKIYFLPLASFLISGSFLTRSINFLERRIENMDEAFSWGSIKVGTTQGYEFLRNWQNGK